MSSESSVSQMRTVALIEVIVIMGRITIGAFTFQNGSVRRSWVHL